MTYKSLPHDEWEDKTLQIVGKITIAFGQLEHVLKLAYKRAIGKPYSEAMYIIDKISGNPALADGLRKKFAIQRMDQNLEAEMNKIIDRILKVNGHRNFLIHGYWHKRISDDKLLVVKKGCIAFHIDANSLSRLEVLHREITNIRDTLNKFTRAK